MLFAGSDTTANTISSIVQVLSKHEDVQRKLRDEIASARGEEDLSYEQLTSLPYLDAVCRETMRLWVDALHLPSC